MLNTMPMALGAPKPPQNLCGRYVASSNRISMAPRSAAKRDKSLAMIFLFLACVSLIFERRDGGFKALTLSSKPLNLSRHVAGLCWSAVAIVGRPMASALRKEIATPRAGKAVSHAEQVGMTSLIQGLVAMGFMVLTGNFSCSLPNIFWICLASSSFLNAIIKTAETHAYKVGEMSLCAPFLAFDPVIQLLVGSILLPFIHLLCGDTSLVATGLSLRKASAVLCIAAGMLALSMTEKAASHGGRALPKGAGFIILNCFLYSATYRLDAAAVGVSSSLCLFAYCRLVMAVLCFIPSFTRTRKFDAPGENDGLWEPRTLALLLFVCVVDAAYMLSMYQAVSLISPVLVSAVKRGGGIVVSALFGAVFFGEKLEGRKQLLCVVAIGVMILCI
eukprot:symbB.v1.2.030984.t1/scaffold3546.1/size54311/2